MTNSAKAIARRLHSGSVEITLPARSEHSQPTVIFLPEDQANHIASALDALLTDEYNKKLAIKAQADRNADRAAMLQRRRVESHFGSDYYVQKHWGMNMHHDCRVWSVMFDKWGDAPAYLQVDTLAARPWTIHVYAGYSRDKNRISETRVYKDLCNARGGVLRFVSIANGIKAMNKAIADVEAGREVLMR